MRRGISRCAAAAVLFGATTPFASRLSSQMSAPALAGLLYLGAALAVAPTALRRGASRRSLRRGAGRLAIAIGAGGVLGPLLLALGLGRTPAATVSLLLNLEVVATTLIAAVFFREHIGRRAGFGVACVVAAGALLAWSGTPDFRVGALFVIGACVCWGVDNSVTADLGEVAPEHVTLLKGAVAGTTNLLLAIAIGSSVPSAEAIGATLVVGGLGYGASITLWIAGARELGAARGQLVFGAAPLVGVVLAWLAFGERVRAAEVAALGLASVGVAFVLRSSHVHEHNHVSVSHDHPHGHEDGHHDHAHDDDAPRKRHSHPHHHAPVVHDHPHVPDLHHRHAH